jgi:hypothetical protein
MEQYSPTANSRLRFDQTFPMHTSYLTFIYSQFYHLTGAPPKVNFRKADKRTNKVYASMAFKTLALPCLKFYKELFYLNGVKIIPMVIANYFTPRALAFLICDDGGKDSNNQTILHTRSYTYAEILILQAALSKNFQLRTRVTEKTPGQWIIHIPIKQEVSLRDIVLPYIHYSFMYKI